MDQTYKRFLQKLQQNMLNLGIQAQKHKILVACSGGLDSTALVHALHSCGYSIRVAHVNYKLRAEESDRNEAFVSGLCAALNIPLHLNSFDTRNLLESNNKNLQELARELRYQWFEELLKDHGLNYIATGHHADDQAETLIHHFLRGSSLNGLSGIAYKRERIIRPFLNFSREEIYNISLEQGWEFSPDSSNDKNDYTRNFIRNKIMPLVKEINPSVSETLSKQAALYNEMNTFLKWSSNDILRDLIQSTDEFSRDLDIKKIKSIPGYIVVLYEFLRGAGFTNDQVQQVAAAIDSNQSGLLLRSKTHKLLVDRSLLKVSLESTEKTSSLIIWDNDSVRITLPDGINLFRSNTEPEDIIHVNKINVDSALLNQTLYLRHWKKGDIFYPVGMKGRSKKVSDYFIDTKIDRFEKDKKWFLVNDKDEIIWITGMRADHRFLPESAEQSCWIYIES